MSMDAWEIARTILTGLAFIVSVAALVLTRRDQHLAAQKSALAAVEKKVSEDIAALKDLAETRRVSHESAQNEISRDVAQLREAIKHLPTVRDIDLLQASMSVIASAVAKQEGTLESNTRMVERMNQFLMERGT